MRRSRQMKLDRRSLLGIAGLVLAGSGTAAATRMGGDDSTASEADVSLTEQAARDTATDEVDGSVRAVELEAEDGTPVYEVEVEATDGIVHEVEVDADDGTVLEAEVEDDDEDDREDDDREDDDREDDDEDDREDST
jgi:uncharacterized membrane protein YkoI